MSRGEAEEEALFIPELCSEAEKGKVPQSLASLYSTAQCNSASDCLVLAAHVLLLETGFLPQGRETPVIISVVLTIYGPVFQKNRSATEKDATTTLYLYDSIQKVS
ncbi:F-box only protein 7-like [Tachysurus fulvidraco]|uniref:F-box only protein 7-like n=1 Tax=Tachysurus fulvidraco TaxID=1234273 RepID=UPI001FEEA07E|nr:F-box only protein 7-like [Tachysurus fulvidraco]XP_047675156.1 F-box only protein 7-like [Tachysurus fulvidraco]XP_047675157.1 F-box only protein 7-like [Tachysurus fulvidraco]XP_047675158.1 F-box only protein 7-like [Tachysurus fulvidraco]